MCLDPVSLGLMAAGTATSIAGTSMSRRDQQDAIGREMAAKNAVLKDTLAKEAAFREQNLGTVNDTVAGFNPTVQAGKMDAATGNRNSLIDSTITGPGTAPTGSDTPQIVKDNIASKMLDAFKYSTSLAKAKAAAASYGDVNQGNARAISDASGNIDMTNNFAKGTAAMLPDQQQFAATQVYKPPSPFGPALTSIGGLMAMMGGSGRAGSMSLPSMPNIPGFNPISGVAG
jgi:hypothetical protein